MTESPVGASVAKMARNSFRKIFHRIDCSYINHVILIARKHCYNAVHVYPEVMIGNTETGKESLHAYKYNSCSNPGCGPNYCCCAIKKRKYSQWNLKKTRWTLFKNFHRNLVDKLHERIRYKLDWLMISCGNLHPICNRAIIVFTWCNGFQIEKKMSKNNLPMQAIKWIFMLLIFELVC
jgi:hypothetical protein